MKKTILFLALSLMSLASFAQVNVIGGQPLPLNKNKKLEAPANFEILAGKELQKFANHHYLGQGLSAVGAIVFIAGNNTVLKGLRYVQQDIGWSRQIRAGRNLKLMGGALGLAGVVFQIEAPIHIKNAGLILSGNGFGLKVKLN